MIGGSLRWGVLGCGNVVEFKSGPSIAMAGRSQIVAVMRRDESKARQYADKIGAPTATDRAEDVLERPDVDIVYVATPPSSHEHYVLAAARAGKHVLVEKPMALSAEQGRRMIDACDRAGVRLFVAYYRRFYPQVQKMRELIAEGRIGTPLQAFIDVAMPPDADCGWRETPEISGGGRFIDIASHRVDVLAFLLGDVEATASVIARVPGHENVERVVCASLKLACGATANVAGDFHTGRGADWFSVHGDQGSIVAQHLETPRIVLQRGGKSKEFAFEPFPAPHLGLIRHIESVLAGETENMASGRHALVTEEVLDDAVRRHFPWGAQNGSTATVR